jgi:hypothetical protein
MRGARHIPALLSMAILAMLTALPRPCLARNGAWQQHRQAPKPEPHVSAPQTRASTPPQHVGRPAQPGLQQQGHAGDWLRRYKDMPPAEQERALQNDPAFRHLPPAQQQVLQQRLQHFSNLPPQQQLRMLNRMETWEHLTSEQKTQARQLFGQYRQLPPDRQRQVSTAVRDLRAMPPDQREQVIDSPRFKGVFSDQEREMIRGASKLPLAPPEGGEAGPQE